jgi:hypothetical protein
MLKRISAVAAGLLVLGGLVAPSAAFATPATTAGASTVTLSYHAGPGSGQITLYGLGTYQFAGHTVPLNEQEIVIDRSTSATGPWTWVTDTRTNSSGDFAAIVSVSGSGWYRAVFPGTAGAAEGFSPSVQIVAKTSTVNLNGYVTTTNPSEFVLYGTGSYLLSPTVPGPLADQEIVVDRATGPNGPWVWAKNTHTDSTGNFEAAVVQSSTSYFRAVFPGSADAGEAFSVSIQVARVAGLIEVGESRNASLANHIVNLLAIATSRPFVLYFSFKCDGLPPTTSFTITDLDPHNKGDISVATSGASGAGSAKVTKSGRHRLRVVAYCDWSASIHTT